MKKIFIPILVIMLGSVFIFSHGYNSSESNWNEPLSNTLSESSDSYNLTIIEIDTTRPLAVGQDNDGSEYVINFGFLLNKYNNIPVEVGQTIQLNGQIETHFFSRDMILAKKASINNEEYFIDYQNSNQSNSYGNCGFGNRNNRNYGHGMMGW
ncbi:MAG: hypothetical protein ACQESN_04535 [Thermotogota bacterium]